MNKSRLISACIHLLLFALAIAGLTTVHTVEHQRYHETLVLPMDLPLPVATPSSVKQSSVSVRPVASAARLAINAPALLRVNPASHDAAPQLVKLDASSPLELPQVSQRAVTAAPVARQVGFGQQTGSGNGRGVNQAGFGSSLDSGNGRGGTVKLAAFARPAPVPVVMRTAEPVVVPPVVTLEATPVYSEAARRERISGTVVLRVRFTAEGSVQVLGVGQGLGYGLDESAIRAAESIRFTPAMRDNRPVSFDTTVRITFQLADQ
jgi:TonB family protein